MERSIIVEWVDRPRPLGPVTCAVCGCRLTSAGDVRGERAWRHVTALMPDQDARGGRPRCLDELHGNDGRVLEGAAPGTAIAERRRTERGMSERLDEDPAPAR